jgi:arabinan endo-1,5-alpha-L-arabinosidase
MKQLLTSLILALALTRLQAQFVNFQPEIWKGVFAAGDIDNDGDLDVIVSGETAEETEAGAILINDGAGNFTAQAGNRVITAGRGGNIHFGDIDGDGDIDVIFAGWGTTNNAKKAGIALNDGKGVFTLAPAAAYPINPAEKITSCGFADFDLNGLLDYYFFANDAGNCIIYFQQPDGSFTPKADAIQATRRFDEETDGLTYQNPVFEPDLADPSLIRADDGWFYAYGTQNAWATGVTRITPIIRSADLITWEYVADAFTSRTKPSWHNGGIWAPQIVHGSDGLYYLYYSNSTWGDSNPGIGVAKSQYPYGPFTDLGKVLDTQSSGVANSIDQFYITDGSGQNKKAYLFWGSFQGIYVQEIASDMKTLTGTKSKIAGSGFEGTYIYPHGGKFWLFASSNSCCEGPNTKYSLSVACADKITGPYKTKSGINLTNINDFAAANATKFLQGDGITWIGPGHNGEIIQDDNGRYFILYHAVALANPWLINEGGATRRPLLMDEVHWGDDGWPYIEGGIPSSTRKRAPYFQPK